MAQRSSYFHLRAWRYQRGRQHHGLGSRVVLRRRNHQRSSGHHWDGLYPGKSLQGVNGPILELRFRPNSHLHWDCGASRQQSQPVVVNSSGPTRRFHVDTSSTSWLQASPTDGTTNATVNLVAVPGNLPPGHYLGLATVSIPGVAGSRLQIVPVVFLLNPTI